MTGLSPSAASSDERGRAARSAHAAPPARARYLRTALLPGAVIAWICAAAAAVVLFAHASPHVDHVVLAGVAVGVLLMLAVTIAAARAASRQADAQVRAARLAVQRGQVQLQQLVDGLMRGEQPAPLVPVPVRPAEADPFRQLGNELEQAHYQAGKAVLRVAEKIVTGRSDQRVEIFVNLARRMQSLVHREIELLDDLEAKVEDPDLLKGLFTVDHLATRMRRQSESLAVLGGSNSRRQWTRQVTMHEVLRAAVAEVEQYSRVKVVPPVEGVLRGGAVTDVIHLIAELVENATKFSAPSTIALLRAQHVSAGLAIEVEDRGLGIPFTDQQRMNDLLADPSQMNIDELLRDGRIGLYVVAALARRHGIRVRLENNIYGGTQAVVVLPNHLLEQQEHDRALPKAGFGGDEAPGPRLALVPVGGEPAGAGPAGPAGGGPASAVSASAVSASAVSASAVSARAVSASGGAAGGGLAGAGLAGGGTAGAGVRPGAEAGRGALPLRHPASGASAAPVADVPYSGGGHRPAPVTERPPLPRRQAQSGSAVQPADSPRGSLGDGPAAREAEPPADQMTGLMADFLRGVSQAEEEDSPARD